MEKREEVLETYNKYIELASEYDKSCRMLGNAANALKEEIAHCKKIAEDSLSEAGKISLRIKKEKSIFEALVTNYCRTKNISDYSKLVNQKQYINALTNSYTLAMNRYNTNTKMVEQKSRRCFDLIEGSRCDRHLNEAYIKIANDMLKRLNEEEYSLSKVSNK